ncbi:hypothetical protein L7F22_058576 [Adiantum nelumboides]|nr:hypothetical protein [Adiantum nelumboides]
MELLGESGCIISIPSGCKRKLGRGSELAIFDKTVSRDQVLVELKESREKFSSADHDSPLYGLFIEVLGANPVCILHIRQSRGGRSDTEDVVFLKKGETDTMFVGDKISLSLCHPQFFTVKEGDGKNGLSSLVIDKPGSLAEDDLLQKWKDRKSVKVAGPSFCHATSLSDASTSANRCLLDERDNAANEEEGIAQAVARRQKRAFDRRQQLAQKLHDKQTVSAKDMSDVLQVAHEQDDNVINTQHIDPVKEFGFLVEGSEFDQYKPRFKANRGKWVWPSVSNVEFSSDDDVENIHTSKRKRKAKTEEDEDWGGDDQQEEVAVGSAKDRKLGAKLNLRSHEPSTSKIRDMSIMKIKPPGGRKVKNQREELEEDEDEADETLGGFIVNDDEEDPINDSDDTDDEEEDFSEEDDIDETDEVEDLQQAQKVSAKKREEKPLCKYGKNCYRKNRDHVAEFRHQ